jgi:hypothetical protein
LIQLAGAFVHIQKQRRGPALALLGLARGNLGKYPSHYEALDMLKVQEMIRNWHEQLQAQLQEAQPIRPSAWPVLDFPRSPGLHEEHF